MMIFFFRLLVAGVLKLGYKKHVQYLVPFPVYHTYEYTIAGMLLQFLAFPVKTKGSCDVKKI